MFLIKGICFTTFLMLHYFPTSLLFYNFLQAANFFLIFLYFQDDVINSQSITRLNRYIVLLILQILLDVGETSFQK